ncbi:MAG: hypothetical protein IPN60_15835 [Saprospiraceae bacterium]|nr:hypothetical protein [Candidatus Opimibacter skivensis]
MAPDDLSSGITIWNMHNVTVNTPVTADQIVVEAGATLTQTNNLTLASGAGDDLTVSGTWNWSGNYLYGPGFARIAPGGWLNLTTSSYKYFTTDITNDGTIDFQEGIFRFEDFKTVINNGTFLLGRKPILSAWESWAPVHLPITVA